MGKDGTRGASSKVPEKDVTDMKDMRELLSAFHKFTRDLRAEFDELKKSISFCTDVCNGVKTATEEIKKLRQEMNELVKQNRDLKAENDRLANKCEDLERYQRLNNLEIKGVPTDNDPLTVIQHIGKSVGIIVDSTDIDTSHWVPTKNSDAQNIIVRFVHRSKRDSILTKCRKSRVDTSVLGIEAKDAIYVNEHLTQATKALLSAAIKKKKEVGWKFVWTASCKVLARKDEKAKSVQISTHADLDKIA